MASTTTPACSWSTRRSTSIRRSTRRRFTFPSATSLITLANPFATSNGFVPPAALSIISPNFVPAYVQQWNFNIQREVERVGTFTIAYAGSKGTDLPRSLDINQPIPGPGDVVSAAPYPAYSNIRMTESGGNSEYQSLQLTFNRQIASRLLVLAAYTFSKSIDDTSAFLPTQRRSELPAGQPQLRARKGAVEL